MATFEVASTIKDKLSGIFRSSYMRRLLELALALGRRLAFGLIVLLVVVYLSYFGLDMARGIPFQDALLRAFSESTDYLTQALQGEFGMTAARSYSLLPRPIAEVVPDMVINSLGLLGAAMLIAVPLGVGLGVWASRRRHSNWPLVTLFASVVGISAPSFFAALLLQLGVIQLTRTTGRSWLPVGGFGWDWHLLLPALVLAARPLAQITRVTYVTLTQILDEDYVRTARGKGVPELNVMSVHVIRNAAIAILTTIGVSLRFSLSSLPVVEYFFSWPGMGFNLLKSISIRDDNLTVILVLCLGLLFILINLFLDVAYRLIDPRLKNGAEHVARSERVSVVQRVRNLITLIQDWIVENPIKRWLERRKQPSAPSAFRKVLEERGEEIRKQDFPDGRAGELRAWVQGTVGNLSFVLGGLIVTALLLVVLFGPSLAPHSPYTTQGLTIENGEFKVPPFAPDDTYQFGTDPLGRDIWSLILAGAQQTMLLVSLVVLARMLIGFVAGALAGWFKESWLDRFLMSSAEILSAFPALLLAMILILALGIREGLRPFIIALSFVGWGEIMQFVRGEIMGIRPKLFVESAMAVGARTPRIIFKHVLPNLIPALISIAALEMGSVLMLLGELGFIGIFIGGGAFAELDVAGALYHYSDVPEWGALLSNVRGYARAYPWTAIYPSLAFFIAIVGFNLFGEGIRRLLEVVGVSIARVVNRYTMAAAVLIGVGFIFVRGNTGAMAYYQEQAGAFNAERAMEHIRNLSSPIFDGRSLGSDGMGLSGDYIARSFEDLGIQAAGEQFTYFQNRERTYQSLEAVPEMTILGSDQQPVYHQDYVEFPAEYRNLGAGSGPVRVLAFGELMSAGTWGRNYPALKDLDYSGKILLLPDRSDLYYLSAGIPRTGILLVADQPEELMRRYTLPPTQQYWNRFGGLNVKLEDHPLMMISEDLANRLLQGTGKTFAELRSLSEDLEQDEILSIPTETRVSLNIQGEVENKVQARHVIGHLPGTSAELDDQLIVVLAQYDNPPAVDGEDFYPGANSNASSIGVMLEVIRTMQESGYQPYKTFLFVAYSGEGLEGGEPVVPEIKKFLQTKYGFDNAFDIEAVVELHGLGSAQGDNLVLLSGGSLRLANLFESAANRMDVAVERLSRENVDLSIIFRERSAYAGGEEAPSISLNWEGWQATAFSPLDTLDAISEEHINDSGRALSLALMILGRETQY